MNLLTWPSSIKNVLNMNFILFSLLQISLLLRDTQFLVLRVVYLQHQISFLFLPRFIAVHWPPGTILMANTKYYYIEIDFLRYFSVRCLSFVGYFWYFHFVIVDNGTSFQFSFSKLTTHNHNRRIWGHIEWVNKKLMLMRKCWYCCV